MRSLLCLPILMVMGCAHPIPFDPESSEGRAAVNTRASQERALITLRDGQCYEADALRLHADSTLWLEPETRAPVTVPTRRIGSIAFPSAGDRSAEGFALGLAGGVLLGYAVGARSYNGKTLLSQSRGENAMGGALLFGGAGALIGLLIGYGAENTDVFEPEIPKAEESKP